MLEKIVAHRGVKGGRDCEDGSCEVAQASPQKLNLEPELQINARVALFFPSFTPSLTTSTGQYSQSCERQEQDSEVGHSLGCSDGGSFPYLLSPLASLFLRKDFTPATMYFCQEVDGVEQQTDHSAHFEHSYRLSRLDRCSPAPGILPSHYWPARASATLMGPIR